MMATLDQSNADQQRVVTITSTSDELSVVTEHSTHSPQQPVNNSSQSSYSSFPPPRKGSHRDSDASDVSASHLMVYGDQSQRKSSISFDKIKQISLTYSLQSEEEETTSTSYLSGGRGVEHATLNVDNNSNNNNNSGYKHQSLSTAAADDGDGLFYVDRLREEVVSGDKTTNKLFVAPTKQRSGAGANGTTTSSSGGEQVMCADSSSGMGLLSFTQVMTNEKQPPSASSSSIWNDEQLRQTQELLAANASSGSAAQVEQSSLPPIDQTVRMFNGISDDERNRSRTNQATRFTLQSSAISTTQATAAPKAAPVTTVNRNDNMMQEQRFVQQHDDDDDNCRFQHHRHQQRDSNARLTIDSPPPPLSAPTGRCLSGNVQQTLLSSRNADYMATPAIASKHQQAFNRLNRHNKDNNSNNNTENDPFSLPQASGRRNITNLTSSPRDIGELQSSYDIECSLLPIGSNQHAGGASGGGYRKQSLNASKLHASKKREQQNYETIDNRSKQQRQQQRRLLPNTTELNYIERSRTGSARLRRQVMPSECLGGGGELLLVAGDESSGSSTQNQFCAENTIRSAKYRFVASEAKVLLSPAARQRQRATTSDEEQLISGNFASRERDNQTNRYDEHHNDLNGNNNNDNTGQRQKLSREVNQHRQRRQHQQLVNAKEELKATKQIHSPTASRYDTTADETHERRLSSRTAVQQAPNLVRSAAAAASSSKYDTTQQTSYEKLTRKPQIRRRLVSGDDELRLASTSAQESSLLHNFYGSNNKRHIYKNCKPDGDDDDDETTDWWLQQPVGQQTSWASWEDDDDDDDDQVESSLGEEEEEDDDDDDGEHSFIVVKENDDGRTIVAPKSENESARSLVNIIIGTPTRYARRLNERLVDCVAVSPVVSSHGRRHWRRPPARTGRRQRDDNDDDDDETLAVQMTPTPQWSSSSTNSSRALNHEQRLNQRTNARVMHNLERRQQQQRRRNDDDAPQLDDEMAAVLSKTGDRLVYLLTNKHIERRAQRQRRRRDFNTSHAQVARATLRCAPPNEQSTSEMIDDDDDDEEEEEDEDVDDEHVDHEHHRHQAIVQHNNNSSSKVIQERAKSKDDDQHNHFERRRRPIFATGGHHQHQQVDAVASKPLAESSSCGGGGGGANWPPPRSNETQIDSCGAQKQQQQQQQQQVSTMMTSANNNNNTNNSHASTASSEQPQQKRPIKLRNLLTTETTSDHLHVKCATTNTKSHGCNENRCVGSLINPIPVEQRVRTGIETWQHAKEFIDNYYASIKRIDTPAHKNRLVEIEQQIKSTETYYLKETELIYGAKLAWRNAPRCVGRIQWSKLQVFDARFTRNANDMFEAICNHIKYATNKGSIRSAITIFPQRVKSTQNDWRIWNPQLIGYAGYRDKESNTIVGDPINCDITEVCQRLGWRGKGTRFDILPVVLSANGQGPQLFELPEDLVMRVKIKHPKLDWFGELGLEWYALPAVSSMMLDVGGLQFTACPFNGWYMVTEVGARDLGDTSRYNVLETIAQKMSLNTRTNTSLWKDQALTQLNVAVLDSFQSAGVTMVDHHTACETFMTHLKNEQRLRGGCPADWVWLVPPTAGSTTQLFHQEMVNYHLLPNYEYLPPPWKQFDWIAWERARQEKQTSVSAAAAAAATMAQSKLEPMGASVVAAAAGSVSPSKVSSLLSSLKSNALAPIIHSTPTNSTSSQGANSSAELTPRHLRFKEIARAVKFTSKLFGKALSRRIKATILYATETGKSERFANKLAQQTFSHAFNVHLMSMSDYDMTCLEHEALLLIVTSTFGNGDPPENGELFAKHLAAIKMTGDSSPDLDSINSVSTNPFFQMLSEDHKDGLHQAAAAAARRRDEEAAAAAARSNVAGSSSSGCGTGETTTSSPTDDSDNNGKTATNGHQIMLSNGNKLEPDDDDDDEQQVLAQEQQTNIRPLSNVRFAVFALGSTAYPHFCAFGRYIDQTLGELGAERILKCACGDELCGQEKAFNEWSSQVFKVACDVFCLTDTMEPIEDRAETIWTPQDVKFVYLDNNDDDVDHNNETVLKLSSKSAIVQNLVGIVGKKIVPFSVKRRQDLHKFVAEENLQTICVDLDSGLRSISFKPGDHIGIYPVNKRDVVDKLLERIERDINDINKQQHGDTSGSTISKINIVHNMDKKVSILIKRGNMDPLTQGDEWIQCDTLPVTSIREALTRYLDITNPPNQDFLSLLARQTNDPDEKKRLQQMARNFTIYEEWKNKCVPSLTSVLEQFKTVKFDPALITQIPPMKPRFYSVSGTSISLTLGVVRYQTLSGEHREGLCSNYLNSVPIDPKSYVYGYVRSAPAFHMPQDKRVPMLLISAGTGIAPFRAFWQQRYQEMYGSLEHNNGQNKTNENIASFGRIELYFGCRNSNYVLYKEELDEMHELGVLSSVNIAYSRPVDRDVIGCVGVDVDVKATCSDGEKHTQTSILRKATSKVDSIRQARKRVYVQDKLLENGELVFKSIVRDGAHIYVCGDVAMADGVYKTLAVILSNNLKANKLLVNQLKVNGGNKAANLDLTMAGEDGESMLMNLRNLNRYHEDIFGAKQV